MSSTAWGLDGLGVGSAAAAAAAARVVAATSHILLGSHNGAGRRALCGRLRDQQARPPRRQTVWRGTHKKLARTTSVGCMPRGARSCPRSVHCSVAGRLVAARQ